MCLTTPQRSLIDHLLRKTLGDKRVAFAIWQHGIPSIADRPCAYRSEHLMPDKGTLQRALDECLQWYCSLANGTVVHQTHAAALAAQCSPWRANIRKTPRMEPFRCKLEIKQAPTCMATQHAQFTKRLCSMPEDRPLSRPASPSPPPRSRSPSVCGCQRLPPRRVLLRSPSCVARSVARARSRSPTPTDSDADAAIDATEPNGIDATEDAAERDEDGDATDSGEAGDATAKAEHGAATEHARGDISSSSCSRSWIRPSRLSAPRPPEQRRLEALLDINAFENSRWLHWRNKLREWLSLIHI